MSWSFPGPLNLADTGLMTRLREDLLAAGYTVDGVSELIGPAAMEQLWLEQLAPGRLDLDDARARLDPADPAQALVTMAAWWLFAVPQTASRLEAAFPRTGLQGLRDLGLADSRTRVGSTESSSGPDLAAGEERASAVVGGREADAEGAPERPAMDLRPYESDDIGAVWVASDLGSHQRRGALGHEHVLGIGQASRTLAQAVIRTPARRALDLGVGCGVQTLHMLSHCDKVTATDISERALNVTAFNLLLNAETLSLTGPDGAPRVRLLAGSLLEPVAGEQFDLVVSNPPFVITPRSGDAEGVYTYRDGGLPGDQIVETLVRQLPGVLAPGGLAQMLGNWEIRAGEPWDARPRAWVAGDPAGTDAAGTREPGTEALGAAAPAADAWFIQREETDTLRYALTWLTDAFQDWDDDALAAALARYRDDFAARGTDRVGFGLILLRRPAEAESGWWQGSVFEEITHPIEQPVGPHLAAALERKRAIAAAGASSSEWRLSPAEDVTEERHQRPGAEHPGVILLRQGAGLRRTALLSSEMAGLVSAADGELTLGQLAQALGAILEDAEMPERLVEEALHLVDHGLLLPEGEQTASDTAPAVSAR
ncbi:DUF7059 domain-containing protein [Falsarthrobacter nasiphocae]|uniref:Methyltransferase small domain-containing protein n=1 Tax=Falsarthrobacter nasiphocae TaxID=189863 RepID=A0AAE3YHY5_9MICC|nr:methyltransferase [Falsarthrobacter nasiphocae]MDR6892361.1 hypothetical protein [Falsarthrobacter nasiphocae]